MSSYQALRSQGGKETVQALLRWGWGRRSCFFEPQSIVAVQAWRDRDLIFVSSLCRSGGSGTREGAQRMRQAEARAAFGE